jgi:hypothetical protein
MINTKISKTAVQISTEDKFLKLLESMDWKLWEIYLILKDFKEKKFLSETKSDKNNSTEKNSSAKPKKKFIDKVDPTEEA